MRILAGTETEYGLYIEGRGAADQVEDAEAFVRSYPGKRLFLWDYRHESPRNDLRGFKLEHLAVDPLDAEFDLGKVHGPASQVRADQILPNGARFYNDHGHPEYSTPECWSNRELARHDIAGERVLLETARRYAEDIGKEVRIYKNNTDFHGASYGTHESYLVPRELGFDRLFRAVTPMLVVRQILTGAGKVGSESGDRCAYQISQRADFFMEAANAETLYRRPVFNTRDESHADSKRWARLHVISCDANRIAGCVSRRVGLVKLALRLEIEAQILGWELQDPVAGFKSISRDSSYAFDLKLKSGRVATAYEVIESYLAAAEARLELDQEERALIAECRQLMEWLSSDFSRFARQVDWAAKKQMLESLLPELDVPWGDPTLQAYDLEYHNIDPEEGLFHALELMGSVEPNPCLEDLADCLDDQSEGTRARARGLAVSRFGEHLQAGAWRSLTFKDSEDIVEEIELHPEALYPEELRSIDDVGKFRNALREIDAQVNP